MKAFITFFCLAFAVSGFANETPLPWEVEIEETEGGRVAIVAPKWHKKEGAWLFTCRLEAPAERLVKPVAYIHFKGFGAEKKEEQKAKKEGEEKKEEGDAKEEAKEAEPIWEHIYRTRRKLFKKSYGSKVGTFARTMISDIPAEVKKLKIQFVNAPPPKAE